MPNLSLTFSEGDAIQLNSDTTVTGKAGKFDARGTMGTNGKQIVLQEMLRKLSSGEVESRWYEQGQLSAQS